MGASRKIIQRAARRVSRSSAGEIVGRAINLVLPFALLAIHSIDALMDSFFLAMAIAFFAQGTLGNALVSALIPEFVDCTGKRNIRRFLLLAALTGLIAACLAAVFASAPLSTGATLLGALAVFLMATAGISAAPAAAALNAQDRYAAPGAAWSLRSVPIVLYVLWHPEEPAFHILIAGIALADAGRAVILHRLARDSITLRRNAPALDLPRSALHLIAASSIAGLAPLLARWIASFGETGDITVFEAADRLYGAIASLATIGIGNVILVYMARLDTSPEPRKHWRLILIFTAAWSVLWLVACLLVWLAYPHASGSLGIPSGTAGTEIRQTFLALSLGMPGLIMTMTLGRRMLTLGLSRPLIPLALTGLAFTGIGGAFAFGHLGTPGLGLALSASQIIVASMMLHLIYKLPRHAHTRSR